MRRRSWAPIRTPAGLREMLDIFATWQAFLRLTWKVKLHVPYIASTSTLLIFLYEETASIS